jgi:hypothetical protein
MTAKTAKVSVSAATLATIKARLDPRLNEPYFSKEASGKRCLHVQHGVRLDVTTHRAYCKECGSEIALFDALMNYHDAETRLVSTLAEMKRMRADEIERKNREKERRPYLRAVRNRKAKKDMTLKAEPIIGYDLELECGHTVYSSGDRRMNNVTCHECKNASMVAAAKAKKP